jgi:hypothetical protein
MRKLIALALAMTALSFLPARAGDVQAFKLGFQKGAEAGVKFCRQTIRQELQSVWDLIDASLNYRYLFLAGEVPPPVVVDKTVVKKEGPVSEIERKLEFYPPAYFPVDRIEELRDTLSGQEIIIPKGYAVIVETKSLPLSTVVFYSYLAQTDGIPSQYVKAKDFLYFGSYDREADAESVKKELARIGVSGAEVVKIEKPMKIIQPEMDKPLTKEVEEIAKKLIEKEKRIYLLPSTPFRKGLAGVVYYLQKALVAADTINPKAHPDFNVARLRADINAIINQIEEYQAEHQPYKRVIYVAPDQQYPKKVRSRGSTAEVPLSVREKLLQAKKLLGGD